jgi:hypothetical protein
MEQEEHIQKADYQVAKDAKAGLISKANHEGTMRQAAANKDLLEATVKEIPELKEYLDKGGRVSVAREWLPRRGRPRTRISLTNGGLILGSVQKGGIEYPLTGNMIVAESGKNGAIDALGRLPAEKLLKRVARRIDPKNMGK